MGLSFGTVEEVLSRIHHIRDDKRVAFRARLKHLQRLGFPPGINSGKGRAAEYRGEHVYLLGVALEMLQLGLTPERAVRAIREDVRPIAIAGRSALFSLQKGEDDPGGMFLHFDPAALDYLSDNDEFDEASKTLWYSGRGQIREMLEQPEALFSRLALINVTALIAFIYSLLHENSEEDAKVFEVELDQWLEAHPEDEDDA